MFVLSSRCERTIDAVRTNEPEIAVVCFDEWHRQPSKTLRLARLSLLIEREPGASGPPQDARMALLFIGRGTGPAF
jgi:hypothetical protein